MKRLRWLLLLAACVLALAPSGTRAATTYNETVAGIETGVPQPNADCPAPNSVSPFVGIATGTLGGGFAIGVCHSPLSPDATIWGGVFVFGTSSQNVAGFFAPGGRVTFQSMDVTDSLCVQKYAVSGSLLPSGSFTGTLVHFGFLNGGSCQVFFATITGSAQLTV